MKRAILSLAALSLITCLHCASLANGPTRVRENPQDVQDFIASCRSKGPQGLHSILEAYDRAPDPNLIPIIDAVASQRGAVTSRLFWYTDFDQARIAARNEHKPILYLRLLGQLTDEYSCANSRFFRTVLYSNEQVSKLLREQYVLVWVSERPVPVVTIDYGDGRTLKRTVTGNSIHYILTAEGQVIDALPGLYDPKTFMAVLRNARALAATTAVVPAQKLKNYLDTNENELRVKWQEEARRVAPQLVAAVSVPANADAKKTDAKAAMRRAVSKSAVELPLVADLMPPAVANATDRSIDLADEQSWEHIAALHAADASLDPSSLAVIRGQNPTAYAAPGVLEETVRRFQRNIALDTVHNNYQHRRQILAWLRESPGAITVEVLNRRVYTELFLTPKSDPWLGLLPETTYSAV